MRFAPKGGVAAHDSARLVSPTSSSRGHRHPTIGFDGEHSCAACGRRDRIATIAITRSLSTPSPLVERSSHDVEANAAVERCRSRTGLAMRVRASRTHPSLPRRSRKSPNPEPGAQRAESPGCTCRVGSTAPALTPRCIAGKLDSARSECRQRDGAAGVVASRKRWRGPCGLGARESRRSTEDPRRRFGGSSSAYAAAGDPRPGRRT